MIVQNGWAGFYPQRSVSKANRHFLEPLMSLTSSRPSFSQRKVRLFYPELDDPNFGLAGKRKLLKITSTIQQVCSIRHPNLITVHGSLLARYNPPPNADPSSEGYTITVLTEPIRTQTLQDLLSACGELRPERAIQYLTKLLGAIERIHKDNIVHAGLRPKMILIGGGKSEEETVVKLAGVAWYQRLVDLNKSNPWIWMAEDELPDSWICPGALEEPFVYDRPRDM